jgi:hypothetical protein
MGVKGYKTNKGDLGSTSALVTDEHSVRSPFAVGARSMEPLGSRRRISSTRTALPGRSAEAQAEAWVSARGAPGPHWAGQTLPSALVRPDVYRT